jgi:hypothetical protein
MKPSGPFWSADCWRPGRPEQSNPDVKAARKLLLQYRFDDLLDKQRPKIKTPASPPHSRPSSEATILSTTHDPTYSRQYPRSPRAANRANADFDVRRGTLLHQQTPSYGVGNAYRYGRGSGGTQNVGTPTPGSLAGMSGRYRIGERPSPPGARRMPPNKYGTKDDVTRTIKPDAHQFIEQESQTSDNAHRKPALRFQATQPRSKRPSRRQGTMKRKVAELMHCNKPTTRSNPSTTQIDLSKASTATARSLMCGRGQSNFLSRSRKRL